MSPAMADYIFRVKNSPLGALVVKFYQVEPYSDQAFAQKRVREFWEASKPGSGQLWRLALSQGLVQDNPLLPDFIAQLHARCAHCNCVRIEQGLDR
jgi:hypothetical protein